MRRALVIGASGAIGGAMADRMQRAGWQVTRLSRRDDGLDLTDEASIARHLSALTPPFDRILVTTGALELDGMRPEKALSALTPQALSAQFALNAAGPALVLKHARRLMARDAPSCFAALSARVGSIGDNRLGGWYAYRAAKAALNQLIHTAAIEIARTHPQAVICCLHPGTVATPLTAAYAGGHPTVTPDEAAANLDRVIASLTPADSGGFFDWRGDRVIW